MKRDLYSAASSDTMETIDLILIGAVILLIGVAACWQPSPAAAQINSPIGTATIIRTLSSIAQEEQEGYFYLGERRDGLMILADPTSDLATFLRAKIGRRVKLVISNPYEGEK